MKRGLILLLTLMAPLCASAQVAPAMDSTMVHDMPMDTIAGSDPMVMPGPLGISRGRAGSGTSWLPDGTPMAALHSTAGSWELMLHGNVFVQYIYQGGSRGDRQFGSINWVMGMATRPIGRGRVGLKAMLSGEPWTISGCGYPVLLATGERCEGEPLHDAQHQHDLIMEVAGEYHTPLSDLVWLQLYGGVVGEPALGPVAFPHRPSAMGSPLAPMGHHWLDATHLTFGVVTAGLHGNHWKIEGSLFNGREPDEERTDLDMGRLDSYSARIWLLPTERWSLQLSGGRLNEAEPGHDLADARLDVTRYTASATYHRLADVGMWATTVAVGRNVEAGEKSSATLLESTLERNGHLFFGRAEWAEKSGHDIALASELENAVFSVIQTSVGYTRAFRIRQGLVGIGLQASVSLLPDLLDPYYGSRTPAGLAMFASLRPAPMDMGMTGPLNMNVP